VIGGDTGACLRHEGSGQRYSLTSGSSWTIGRSESCAVVLDSRSVSRLHALVQRLESGGYCLVDLGSRNGSFLNGRRVSIPAAVRDGDSVAFGDQQMEFQLPPEPPRPSTGPADEPTTSLVTHTPATIVVVDIRDFTGLARTVSEDLLAQTIGGWFLRVGRIAEEEGSWAQKYIGDAVMSVWVHAPGTDARREIVRSLQAVCRIGRSTAELSQSLPLPSPLRIGAGVNTGSAVVGNSEFTALGDMVNTAFRLEEATKTLGLGIALGPKTYELLGAGRTPHCPFERREVEMKGYEGARPAYAISFEALECCLPEVSGTA
jgi:adenylate cyclase